MFDFDFEEFQYIDNQGEVTSNEPPKLYFNSVPDAKNFIMHNKLKGTITCDASILNNVRIDCRRKPMNFPVEFTFKQ